MWGYRLKLAGQTQWLISYNGRTPEQNQTGLFPLKCLSGLPD